MGLLQWLSRATGYAFTHEDDASLARAEAQEQAAQAYDHARRTTRLATHRPGTNHLLTGERNATIDDYVSIRGKVELREGCRIGYGAVLLGDTNPDAAPIIIGRDARVGPYNVIRANKAPVIIGDGSSLGPFNVINYNNPEEMPHTGEVRIGANTHTGSYCTFGNNLRIGDNNRISNSTRIEYYTTIGNGNRLEGCILGANPQDLTFYDELDDLTERRKSGIGEGIATPTYLIIGSNNIIRENVRIHRGTKKSHDNTTRVGNDNLIMDHTHIAHDCEIGNYDVITTGCKLAGHVVLENYVNLAGSIKIVPFARIGMCAFIEGDCAIKGDILPFFIAGPEKGREATSSRVPNYRGVQRMLELITEHTDKEQFARIDQEIRGIAATISDQSHKTKEARDNLRKEFPRGEGYDGWFVDCFNDFVKASLERQAARPPRFTHTFRPF